jgi:hypothetical protein
MKVPPGAEADNQTMHSQSSDGDVLPGEERLHARLQQELIETLLRSHDHWGLVVQIEADLDHSEADEARHVLIRSIQAAPGRYSCEFVELSPRGGLPLETGFFTLVPPDEERSRASVMVLAKAAAAVGSPSLRPLVDGQFDALAHCWGWGSAHSGAAEEAFDCP